MRSAFAAVLIVALSAVPAAAQMGAQGQMSGPMKGQPGAPMGGAMRPMMPGLPPAPPPVPPQRLAKAIEFLTLSGTRELIDNYIQRVTPMATMMAQHQLKMTDTGAQRDITAAMNTQMKNGAKEILDNTARVYGGHFSDAELDALVAFFKTPAGKKYVSLRNDLQRESAEVARGWAMKMQMQTIHDEVQKVAKAHPGSLAPPPAQQPMQPAKPGAPAK